MEKREVKLAPDVAIALSEHPAAKARWDKLPFSHQREYNQWIEEAKKPETRARRIDQTIARLQAPTGK